MLQLCYLILNIAKWLHFIFLLTMPVFGFVVCWIWRLRYWTIISRTPLQKLQALQLLLAWSWGTEGFWLFFVKRNFCSLAENLSCMKKVLTRGSPGRSLVQHTWVPNTWQRWPARNASVHGMLNRCKLNKQDTYYLLAFFK